MRILILTCNTGEGHNSCASAIKEACDLRGYECQMEDALSFTSGTLSGIVSRGHVFLYRHLARPFCRWYRYVERHPGMYRSGSAAHRLISGGSQKLADYICRGRYDIVICTHVFGGMLVTETKPLLPETITTAFVATDYACSPGVGQCDLDHYFIPAESLRQEFEDSGIPADRIVVSGIPVRQIFFRQEQKEQAKVLMGVDPGHRHLVVMCGSMGCGPLKRLCREIASELTSEEEMTVVCGTNRRLQQSLQRYFSGQQNVHIQGYVDHVSRLMDSADLYLTKSGGISVTEAWAKGLPMVFIRAVAGCEDYNRRFFMELGGAEGTDTLKDLSALCLHILRDDPGRQKMRQALLNRKAPNAGMFVCEYLTTGDRL